MKVKYLAAAIAAIMAQSAFALSATATYAIQQGTDTSGVAVYLAGASATKPGIYASNGAASVLSNLCVSGTLDAFASSDSNITAYSCTIKSASDLATVGVTTTNAPDFVTNFAGKNLLLGLNVTNGSFTAIQSMVSDTYAATYRNKQIVFGSDGSYATFSTAYQGEGGFMDVNPEMFASQLTSLAPVGITSASYTSNAVGAGQSFGVVVSQALYSALQTAQGLTTAGCTAANVSAACQPSISKSQYASLISSANGENVDWGVLGLTSSQPVRICRRPATSGTQASSDAYFLGSRCVSGNPTPLAATDSISSYVITESSTTGGAKTCLSSTSDYAIGVVSTENQYSLDSTGAVSNTWRYVKLDGVAISDPTIANGVVTNGTQRLNSLNQAYDFNFEFVTVKRNDSNGNPTVKSSLLDGLAAILVNQDIVRTLPGLFVSPLSGVFYGSDNNTSNRVISKTTRQGVACYPNIYTVQ
jgi:hypothetical protein